MVARSDATSLVSPSRTAVLRSMQVRTLDHAAPDRGGAGGAQDFAEIIDFSTVGAEPSSGVPEVTPSGPGDFSSRSNACSHIPPVEGARGMLPRAADLGRSERGRRAADRS